MTLPNENPTITYEVTIENKTDTVYKTKEKNKTEKEAVVTGIKRIYLFDIV